MPKDNKLLWLKIGLAAVVAIMIFGVRYAQVSGVPQFWASVTQILRTR